MAGAVAAAQAVIERAGADVEIGVYANAFESGEDDGAANETLHGTRADLTGETYGRFACDWAAAGATLVGGCCGIGAAHIHRLAQARAAGGLRPRG
jgi:S-methylmethionine-dependent homocysteine/selenocysteine methylase